MEKILQLTLVALLCCTNTMANTPELRLDKQVYTLNDSVKINYANVRIDKVNWIGIWRYENGPGSNAHNIDDGPWHQKQTKRSDIWTNIGQTSGELEFDAKILAPGRYAVFLLKENSYEWLSNPVIFDIADANKKIQLKTLALNIWLEGTMVSDGFNGLVNEIIASSADIALLSEVKNYKGDFMQRLAVALNVKGFKFYTHHSASDVGILSRFPIKNHTSFNEYFTKTLIDINNVMVVFYNCHLDYLHYSTYFYRGYEYGKGKLDKPVTDVTKILSDNNKSKRPAAMRILLADAKKELNNGKIVTVSGDFNEPSLFDYTYETKNMYEHNGVIVPWPTTKLLNDAGYRDAYRTKYPDPVKYPGITWPSDNGNKNVKNIIDIMADIRDRIDYIFYYPDTRLSLQNVLILGPSRSIKRDQRVEESTDDKFLKSTGEWPSDHKGVLATFNIGGADASH